MKIGTKSLLYGGHQFAIHPFVLAYSWYKLYGFKGEPNLWNWRLWIAFLVHDWGYWGKPNMDGPEDETHVELGAKIMSLFDSDCGKWEVKRDYIVLGPLIKKEGEGECGWRWRIRWSEPGIDGRYEWSCWNYDDNKQGRSDAMLDAARWTEKGSKPTKRLTWQKFCLYHSRFYAKQQGQQPSRLCYADKVAIYTLPKWTYLMLVRLTGEYKEYMIKIGDKYHGEGRNPTEDMDEWYDEMVKFLKKWVVCNCPDLLEEKAT
jgi:hypothetical protein